jgi:hypothetical protein
MAGVAFLSKQVYRNAAGYPEKLNREIEVRRELAPVFPHFDESELYSLFREIRGAGVFEDVII